MSGFHLLQNGVPRSGNVWLNYLLRDLIESAGIPLTQRITDHPVSRALAAESLPVREASNADFIEITPLRCFFTILDSFRWPIEDLARYVAGTSLVATHSDWNDRSAEVYRAFSHRIYLVRDPRDAALSLSRFECQPGNRLHRPHPFADPGAYLKARFAQFLESWVQHVSAHLARRKEFEIHVLFYERLVARPEIELESLAHYLGLDLSSPDLTGIIARNRMETMRARQPEHTDRGGWGRWREDLSPLQLRQAGSIAGPLLESLGYPLSLQCAKEWKADDLNPELRSDAP